MAQPIHIHDVVEVIAHACRLAARRVRKPLAHSRISSILTAQINRYRCSLIWLFVVNWITLSLSPMLLLSGSKSEKLSCWACPLKK